MTLHSDEPMPIIPALAPLYTRTRELGWPLIRFFAGVMLMPHGAQKLFGWFGGGGLSGTTSMMAKMGYEPAMLMAILAGATEFFGGLFVAIGFLTRPAAIAAFILLMVAVFGVHIGNGFFVTQGGYEYALLWGMVVLGIALRGGEPLSIDRAMGREF